MLVELNTQLLNEEVNSMSSRRRNYDPEITEEIVDTVEPKEVKSPRVLTTTAPLNLRKTAGDMSNDAILVIIPADTKITTTASDEKDTEDGVHWIEVRYGKIVGWINDKFVK